MTGLPPADLPAAAGARRPGASRGRRPGRGARRRTDGCTSPWTPARSAPKATDAGTETATRTTRSASAMCWPAWSQSPAHADGYRLSGGAQPKLQCVTGKRWVPAPDRRIGMAYNRFSGAAWQHANCLEPGGILGSRPGSRLCCTTSSPTPPRARSLACPELALGATRRPVLAAVSNQMGADVRAMTARLPAARPLGNATR